MADEDTAIAELANGLNEDSKAARKKKAAAAAAELEAQEDKRGHYTRAEKAPQDAKTGDAWEDAKGKIRYSYGDGGWYLSPPPGFLAVGDGVPDVDTLPHGEVAPPADEAEVVDEVVSEPEVVAEAAEQVGEPVRDPEVETSDHSEDDDSEHPGAAAIERAAEQFDPQPGTAVAQLRDFILTTIKQVDKPYHLLKEAAQVDIIRSAEYAAEEVVRGIVEMVAARGQKPIRVLLKKMAAGDKLQITGEVSLLGPDNPDDSLLVLHHAIGKHVMLTRATIDDYKQGPEAKPEPDEPEIEFESEDLSDEDEQADDDSANEGQAAD